MALLRMAAKLGIWEKEVNWKQEQFAKFEIGNLTLIILTCEMATACRDVRNCGDWGHLRLYRFVNIERGIKSVEFSFYLENNLP